MEPAGPIMRLFTLEKPMACPLLTVSDMKKLTLLRLIAVSVVLLSFASCANAPQSQAGASPSPTNRNNGNGLASYMH